MYFKNRWGEFSFNFDFKRNHLKIVSKAMKEKYDDNVQEYFRFHSKMEKKSESEF